MTRQKPGRWLLKRFTLGFAVAAVLLGADFDWNLPKGFPRPIPPRAVIPIIGARKLSQFQDNLASFDLTLSADHSPRPVLVRG